MKIDFRAPVVLIQGGEARAILRLLECDANYGFSRARYDRLDMLGVLDLIRDLQEVARHGDGEG